MGFQPLVHSVPSFSFLSAAMAALWARYLSLLDTRPVLTKSITSATLYLAGDAMAQKLDGTIDKKGYDVVRARTALIWGGILFAPAAHVWYNRVLNPLFPGSGARNVVLKMLCDQMFWAGPTNAAYLYVSSMLSGKSSEQAAAITKSQIVPVMKANYATWPIIQLVNFRFVPPPLQVPVINVVLLGWSCFLAVKANEGNKEKDESKAVVVQK
jgi:protein Mpv17